MTPSLVVHYQELMLKGRNRAWFVERLVRNLREVSAGLAAEVRPRMGGIEVIPHADAPFADLATRVRRTLGVASVALGVRTTQDLAAMTAAACSLVAGRSAASFRVRVRRGDKSFPMSSPDVERHIGSAICGATGWTVNLSSPACVVGVEIVPRAAYVYVGRRRGPGGLPVGVSGRVACLLSGGIDSPVAAYRLMRRGCRVLLIHFHSHPVTSTASREKAVELARRLTAYQLRSRLVLVPFGDVQRQVVVAIPPPQRVVIYRRLMLRIAERIAWRSNARALVTGEAIGQVASQTLENLATIDAAARGPVFRPLIGMDKEQIVAEARRIGTFETSILPDEDCCQVFVPRSPAINVSREEAELLEQRLPIEQLVQNALSGVERLVFAYPDCPPFEPSETEDE
ncbi:MAG: tRNA uracil 4-sulfurtransferase ThiI [Vicinamibacterales bacterium]